MMLLAVAAMLCRRWRSSCTRPPRRTSAHCRSSRRWCSCFVFVCSCRPRSVARGRVCSRARGQREEQRWPLAARRRHAGRDRCAGGVRLRLVHRTRSSRRSSRCTSARRSPVSSSWPSRATRSRTSSASSSPPATRPTMRCPSSSTARCRSHSCSRPCLSCCRSSSAARLHPRLSAAAGRDRRRRSACRQLHHHRRRVGLARRRRIARPLRRHRRVLLVGLRHQVTIGGVRRRPCRRRRGTGRAGRSGRRHEADARPHHVVRAPSRSSRSSPSSSRCPGRERSPRPARTTNASADGSGSRSSHTSTPCSFDRAGLHGEQVGENWSRGAASTSRSCAARARRGRACAPAARARGLHQREDGDEDEHHVEHPIGAADTFGERDRGEDDRDGTPQTGRGQESFSRQASPKPIVDANTDAGRASSSRTRPMASAGRIADGQPGRRRQQSEHHEQPDLREPPDALDETRCRASVRQRRVAEDERRSRRRRGTRWRRALAAAPYDATARASVATG